MSRKTGILVVILLAFSGVICKASDFSDNTFLIAHISSSDYANDRLWRFIEEKNWVALEFDIDTTSGDASIKDSDIKFRDVLDKIAHLTDVKDSKIIPVFINYSGNIHFLDSIIGSSPVSRRIFYLPQGETWPSTEYLVQADRRIIFFIDGDVDNESRILHPIQNYALQISASTITPNSVILSSESNINKELFKINEFNRLPTGNISSRLGKNMVPDYVNFLLDSWQKYGKKPNFIDVGNASMSFDFLIDQLNSFSSVKGLVRTPGKNMERVYWKNPDILISGGKFSFPIRGGEEIILSPFAPGYSMTPAQLIITAEMSMPEEFSVMAHPLSLSSGLTAAFDFDGVVTDRVNADRNFEGVNYSFTEDIDRGTVLKLPENANIVIGDPSLYGLPNSSFTVSCFVKFTDILEFGDNAILGNNEQGYRRGLHLVLRSGHPYFGLWSNDFISEAKLENNTWYHLTWRYIIETGQQTIFLNGKNVGGSDGHPPYSGTNNLHIGSALSSGASMRGYIDDLLIWDRPLGNEEINRLSLDEEIQVTNDQPQESQLPDGLLMLFVASTGILLSLIVFWLIFRRKKEISAFTKKEKNPLPAKNQIRLFGEFKAVNTEGEDITSSFTPKVKELLIFTIVHNLRNKNLGAPISEIDATLWEGIAAKKVANNRAVTLNKLRKILVQFDQLEIVSNNGYLLLKTENTFFCDYFEAFKLCQIPEGMTREQLETFFHLVKGGSLLKGIDWPWLDEIRGYIGNQVIDNLLKLAMFYKKENKLKNVENVAERILDYDNLSEEAVYLQIWSQRMARNTHLAKFHFEAFCTRYKKSMGEQFSMSFNEFIEAFKDKS